MHLCYFTRWQKSKIEVNLGFLCLFGSVEEYWYPNIAEIKVVGPSLSKKQSDCGIYCLWSFKPRNSVLMCSLGLFEYQALKKNIYPHKIPFKGNQRPEVRKRRMRWIQFMSVKCTKWTPTLNWHICLIHFKPEDFPMRFPVLREAKLSFVPWLIVDDIGIADVPLIQCALLGNCTSSTSSSIYAMSTRDCWQVHISLGISVLKIWSSIFIIYSIDPKKCHGCNK